MTAESLQRIDRSWYDRYLSNWGTDGPGADLAAENDVVDVFDLFVLLGSWGGCIGAVPADNPTLEDVVTTAGLTMTNWNDFVEVMEEGETDDKINYLCWMKNHLSGCTTCPPCEKGDPFEEE